MIIIETCPKCGADLINVVIATDPPIPTKLCEKCGWSWTANREADVVRVPFIPPEERRVGDIFWPDKNYAKECDDIPDCCVGCSNHPKNGGSGMCMCTLPYFSGRGVIR